jgi:hypothetical protein
MGEYCKEDFGSLQRCAEMSSLNSSNNIAKTLIILLAIIFIFRNFLMLSLVPVGYTVDIYEQLGMPVLFFTVVIYIYGLILSKYIKSKTLLNIIYFILILNTLTFILTPKLLGYYVADRGDSLSALGLAKTVVSTNHIDNSDFYPLLSVHIAIIERITGISFSDVIWAEIMAINLMFFLGTYIYISRIYKNAYILMLLSITPWLQFYHATIIAQFFAFSFLFFWLLSLLETEKRYFPWYIILLLASTFLVFAHPFVMGYAILILFLWVLRRKIKHMILLILIVMAGTWVIHSYLLLNSLLTLLSHIYGIFIPKQIMYAVEVVDMPLSQLLKFATVRFLPFIALSLILTVLILIVYYEKRSVRSLLKEISEVSRDLTFGGICYSFFLFFLKHGYDRILGLNFAFFGIASLLSEFWKLDLRRKGSIFVFKILQVMSILILAFSIFSVFLSPINGFPFSGITDAELLGSSFVFSKMTNGDKLIDPLGESKRLSIWYYGYSETFKVNRVLYLYRLPDHFGYDKINNFADNNYIWRLEHNIFGEFEKQKYDYSKLIIGIPKAQIEWYEKVQTYSVVGRFTYHDLMRLRADPTVNILYCNGEYSVFKVAAR